MHLALSSVTLVPVLSAALLIVAGIALVQRSRGSSSRGSYSRGSNSRGSNTGRAGSRHSAAPRVGSRFGAAPDPRFAAGPRSAPGLRFAADQGARFAANPRFASDQGASFAVVPHFAAAQGASFAAGPRYAAAQGASLAAGPRPASDLRLAPDLRLASDLRLARDLSLAPEVRLVPDLSVVPDPADHAPAAPDPRRDSQPDPGVAMPAPSWTAGQPLSFSVLAAFTEEADSTRPSFAPSNSGDAFPTRSRALSLLGGHVLATLGIFVLSLASTPLGRHMSHVGNTSVGSLAILCVFVSFAVAVVAAARVQHDIMGGGWYGGFPIRYISPQVALYVIGPSGISAAARRLNVSPARVILAEYGLLAASVLIVLDRFTAR